MKESFEDAVERMRLEGEREVSHKLKARAEAAEQTRREAEEEQAAATAFQSRVLEPVAQQFVGKANAAGPDPNDAGFSISLRPFAGCERCHDLLTKVAPTSGRVNVRVWLRVQLDASVVGSNEEQATFDSEGEDEKATEWFQSALLKGFGFHIKSQVQ